MIRPHVPELGLRDERERAKLSALRALRNCGVIRVTLGRVPLGFRLLQTHGLLSAKAADEDHAHLRLSPDGAAFAARYLQPPRFP